MQTVTDLGTFTRKTAAIINANFASVSAPAADPVYVSTAGKAGNRGTSWADSFATVQAAVNAAQSGAEVRIGPGSYDETVTIARGKTLVLVGVGAKGAIAIAPSTAHAGAMVVNADNVQIVNLDLASPDTTSSIALHVTGNGFRAYDCKFEGAAQNVVFGPGTVAQVNAGTAGHGGDAQFYGCEFAFGTNGIVLTGTDYGGATQCLIDSCFFHDLTTAHVTEAVGSGGSAAVTFFGLWVKNSFFDAAEDGTAPTKYFSLNANNANTGLIVGNYFRVAANSGLNLVSTKAIWTGNFLTGGISTGQPS